MQTVSKYGAADAEAQTPAAAPEGTPIGRAKVALICVAAALSGAAVAGRVLLQPVHGLCKRCKRPFQTPWHEGPPG